MLILLVVVGWDHLLLSSFIWFIRFTGSFSGPGSPFTSGRLATSYAYHFLSQHKFCSRCLLVPRWISWTLLHCHTYVSCIADTTYRTMDISSFLSLYIFFRRTFVHFHYSGHFRLHFVLDMVRSFGSFFAYLPPHFAWFLSFHTHVSGFHTPRHSFLFVWDLSFSAFIPCSSWFYSHGFFHGYTLARTRICTAFHAFCIFYISFRLYKQDAYCSWFICIVLSSSGSSFHSAHHILSWLYACRTSRSFLHFLVYPYTHSFVHFHRSSFGPWTGSAGRHHCVFLFCRRFTWVCLVPIFCYGTHHALPLPLLLTCTCVVPPFAGTFFQFH